MSLTEFLVWLTGANSAIAASWILERIPAFHKLAAETKQLVFFLCCLVLSLASYSVLTFVPPDVIEQLSPWFAVVSTTFMAVFLGTGYYKLSKPDKASG